MPACCYGLALYHDLGVPTKPKVRIQTLESLAYTLNHIFLKIGKSRHTSYLIQTVHLWRQNQK